MVVELPRAARPRADVELVDGIVCQVMTVDEDLLVECAGRISRRVMARVDGGLRLALDLP